MPALRPPKEIQEAFADLSSANGGNISAPDLQEFVDTYFAAAGRCGCVLQPCAELARQHCNMT